MQSRATPTPASIQWSLFVVCPQCGQASALSLISFPHATQGSNLYSAIVDFALKIVRGFRWRSRMPSGASRVRNGMPSQCPWLRTTMTAARTGPTTKLEPIYRQGDHHQQDSDDGHGHPHHSGDVSAVRAEASKFADRLLARRTGPQFILGHGRFLLSGCRSGFACVDESPTGLEGCSRWPRLLSFGPVLRPEVILNSKPEIYNHKSNCSRNYNF